MDYITKIRNNLKTIKKVSKIAKHYNISYEMAKIMYNNGDRLLSISEAEEIHTKMEYLKVPYNIMRKYCITDDFKPRYELSESDICKEISRTASGIDLQNKYPGISASERYGQYLLDLMDLGFSLGVAKKLFETRIKIHMKIHKMTYDEAFVQILYFDDKEASKIYTRKKDEYKNLKGEDIVIKALKESDEYKRTVLYGITLVSKTDEGLKKLIKVVEFAYSHGDINYLTKLTEMATKNNLIVSDFSLGSKYDLAYYTHDYKYVYLDSLSGNFDESVAIFYHETGHFIDNAKKTGSDYWSTNNKRLVNLFNMIEKKINIYGKAFKMTWRLGGLAREYTDDLGMLKKWEHEIKLQTGETNEEIIKEMLEQKIMYERKRYKLCSDYFCDIYDAIKKGKTIFLGASGHTPFYYKDEEERLNESIANIATIFNSGGKDMLYYELGKEITDEIITIYNEFIEYQKNTENTIQVVSSCVKRI